MGECYDKLRFSLSDENGELRFESFEIDSMPECRQFAERLKQYLLSRPLKDVDSNRVRLMHCPGAGECAATMAGVVEDFQQMFLAAAGGGSEWEKKNG